MRFLSHIFFFLLLQFHVVKVLNSKLPPTLPSAGLDQTQPSSILKKLLQTLVRIYLYISLAKKKLNKNLQCFIAWQIDPCWILVYLVSSSRYNLALIAKLVSIKSGSRTKPISLAPKPFTFHHAKLPSSYLYVRFVSFSKVS